MLRPRTLVDVSRRGLGTSLLGVPVAAPVVVAPMASQRLAHPDGELATARAAAALGLLMTASTFATASLEDIAAAATGPLWFQLYVDQDRGITRDLVQRAEAAGYRALVLTVDVPEIGRRERDERNQCRSCSSILRADDACRAVESGVAGIVVSNHGGRQLDTAIASLDALPAIADAVGDRVLVLVDGGVRRGTDIVKALALGARAVLVGRPVIWGLALEGEAGARRVLGLLRDELDLAMALCGAPTLADIGRDLLA